MWQPRALTHLNHAALEPFHRNAEGEFWTSAGVRDCTVFAYSYPELVNRGEGESLVRRVNSLYGENATSQFTFRLGDPIRNGYTARRAVQLADTDRVQRRMSLQRGPFQYQYYANVRTQKSGMEGADGAYKVFVFVGRTRQLQDSMAPMDWLHDASFVGFTGFQSSSTVNYGGYGGSAAEGSGKQNANGVVALTKALEERMEAGELRGMDEKTVGEYLNREMSWRISTVGCLVGGVCDGLEAKADGGGWCCRPTTSTCTPSMRRALRLTCRTPKWCRRRPTRFPRFRTVGSNMSCMPRAEEPGVFLRGCCR